jgi:hypothetical protein
MKWWTLVRPNNCCLVQGEIKDKKDRMEGQHHGRQTTTGTDQDDQEPPFDMFAPATNQAPDLKKLEISTKQPRATQTFAIHGRRPRLHLRRQARHRRPGEAML